MLRRKVVGERIAGRQPAVSSSRADLQSATIVDQESVAEVRPAIASARLTLPCVHCTEPTLCDATQDASRVFCCSGCRGAYDLIHGWGLQEFYALREQMPLSGTSNPANQRDQYEQFDTPDYLGKDCLIENKDGTHTAELAVHGLHCGACAWLIETAVEHEAGLISARVQMSQHSIRLIFDPTQTQLSKIARFLDRLGYSLTPLSSSRDSHIRGESRRQLVQIAIAGFLAANAMWIAVALYAGEFTGVEVGHKYFLGLVGTALGLTAVAIPGRTFFIGAIAAIKHRIPHMDLPVALGLLVGSIVGTYNAIQGAGHVYFDSLSALVFLLLIGRWIQFRQQQRAMSAVDLMMRITPRHAVLLRNDATPITVLAETLTPDDLIRVAVGESIAADGVIVAGETRLDRSLLSGESRPVRAVIGDVVSAGTINLSAPIDVRVTAVGRESRIGRVMKSVENATSEKTPVVLLADRIGGYFVVVVTVLALLTFASWMHAGLSIATANATSLLIVACPCALALATPLAIAVGLGRAATRGILIRDGSSFQQLSRPGTIWLDKTGTLTEGKQCVSAIFGTPDGLEMAAVLEARCKHPVADAIVAAASVRCTDLTLHCDDESLMPIEAETGGGVCGTVIRQGAQHRVAAGNLSYIRRGGNEIASAFQEELLQVIDAGASPVLIAIDGKVVTLVGISDRLREGAHEAIESLRSGGWKVGILSGDHADLVLQVGAQLGLQPESCLGGLSPEEKLDVIRRPRSDGSVVVMVGDGANDAAALAAADVGIAVRGGAEVSLQAASIFISTGALRSLLTLIRGARKTTQLIWITFAISLSYNLIAVGLAIAGWITPLIAAILMPVSSVSILAITLASKTFEKNSP